MVYIWFNILADLFYWVGLFINMRKTVIMAYSPCYTPGGFWELLYTRQVTGIAPSYQDRLMRRVE